MNRTRRLWHLGLQCVSWARAVSGPTHACELLWVLHLLWLSSCLWAAQWGRLRLPCKLLLTACDKDITIIIMCVCVYIYIYICITIIIVTIIIYITYIYIYMYIYIYIYIHTIVDLPLAARKPELVALTAYRPCCLRAIICTCMYVYVYIYIYTHIYIHIYIYIYIYVHTHYTWYVHNI